MWTPTLHTVWFFEDETWPINFVIRKIYKAYNETR
jgi:hypothetical protein